MYIICVIKFELPNPLWGFPGGASGKELACQCQRPKSYGLDPGIGRSGGRVWQHTPAFLPGESHGQRSLAGCSPWVCKKLDTTGVTSQQQQPTLRQVQLLQYIK